PSDDKRWRIVEGTMRRHGHRPDALIETLHTVQETFGYLDLDGLRFVADALRTPLSRAYGVATFYHHFTLRPPGRHALVVCLGTACYIKGANALVEAVRNSCGVGPGETTEDGQISFLTISCPGVCSQAPVASLDGEMVSQASPADLAERLDDWRH